MLLHISVLSENLLPVKVLYIYTLVCIFLGVLPGLNGDPSSIPEERVGAVSPKTTPTDTDTDLSI